MVEYASFVLDLVLGLGVGVYARHLGRRGVLWFLLSLFVLTPLLCAPLLYLMGQPNED